MPSTCFRRATKGFRNDVINSKVGTDDNLSSFTVATELMIPQRNQST